MEDSEIMDMYVNKKMTLVEIGRKVCHAQSYIAHILEKNGIPRRYKGIGLSRKISSVDIDNEIVRMHRDGMSGTEICKIYNLTRQAIDLRLKKLGIRGRAIPRCRCGCGEPSRRNTNRKERPYYKIIPEHRVYKDTHIIKKKYTVDQVKELYRQYPNLESVAGVIGVHSHTLARYLRDHNIVGMYPSKVDRMGYNLDDIRTMLSRMSSRKVASELGISTTAIWKYMKVHNIPATRCKDRITSMGYTPSDMEDLLQEYQDIGKVADHIGVTYSTLYYYIRKYDISRR